MHASNQDRNDRPLKREPTADSKSPVLLHTAVCGRSLSSLALHYCLYHAYPVNFAPHNIARLQQAWRLHSKARTSGRAGGYDIAGLQRTDRGKIFDLSVTIVNHFGS